MKYLILLLALTGCGQMGVDDSEHTVEVSGGTDNAVRLEIGSCDKFAENMDEYLDCVGKITTAQNAILEVQKLFDNQGNNGKGNGK